jgi:hypothetical protein
MDPSTDQNASAVAHTYCATDFSCAFDQECVDGSCRPSRPALRPHIQTASILLRAPLDLGETAWRATHFDLLLGGLEPDEIRAYNPNARLFEYTLTRFHTFDTEPKPAAEWAAAHGYDPEDFYLHYRENVNVPTWEGRVIVPGYPAGMVPGWNPGGPNASATQRAQSRVIAYYRGSPQPTYFANITHPGYRQFFTERCAGLIDGTWYYNQPLATGPIDGVWFDEAIWYPLFGEGLLNKSTEYYGIPITDTHPYALAYRDLYPFMSETLLVVIGVTVDVMPNYGHVMFLNYPNPTAMAIQTTTPWILGEVWVTHTGTSSPTSGSNRCITYDKDYVNAVREIIDQTRLGGRRILGALDKSNGTSGSDRGKMFTLGLYYLLGIKHTFYEYETVDQSPSHLSTWGWNAAVDFNVGQPIAIPGGMLDFEGLPNTKEHWVFATGQDPYAPALTYRVLARRFSNALVLVKMLPLGSVVDFGSTTVHQLDRAYRVLQADGTLGMSLTQVSIRNNEALILIPETMTGIED